MIAGLNLTTPSPDSEAAGAATLPEVPGSALYPLHGNVPAAVDGAAVGPGASDSSLPLKTFLREQEQSYLNRTLQQCGGDKEKAALQLGVSLATLYRKLSGEDKDS
jgi:DNA-binding NtrC family response regulator